MSHRAEILRSMHAAGLRLDDAATAADITMCVIRRQRDELIFAADAAGMGCRQIARIMRLTPARVSQLLNAGRRGLTQA